MHMPNYYPIMLDIEDKKCTVIGGGSVAYRKITSLLDCAAKVTVISIVIDEEINNLADEKKITYIQDNYNYKYISGSYLVYAATNDRKINELIFKDCSAENILINVVDEPDICNFIVPAKVKRGNLTVAISTNGSSPMLAKKIREDLETAFDYRYELFLDIMVEIRKIAAVWIKSSKRRSDFYREVTYSDLINKVNNENKEEIKAEIYKTMQKYME